jgi:DNA-directed RNA polymerase beta subunit
MPLTDLPEVSTTPAPALTGAIAPVKKPKVSDQDLLRPSDVVGLRKRIYDHAFDAVKNLEPIANSRYRLRVENPRWVDPETWSPSHQKKVFYHGGTLARRIQGDWVMDDVATGQPISRKDAVTIAAVPHLNDRGLFLLNGSHWHLGSQTRLDPGIYPRIQANGDVEAMVNPKGGNQHRVALDPASGVFHMEMGSSKIPLLPLLKAMGVTNDQLHEAWGRDLVVKNAAKDDGVAVGKLLKKLFPDKEPPEGVPAGKAIADKLASMQFDPYVTSKTVKRGHTQHGLDALLDTTRELLAINRGESKPSDRDHQAFQHILGPEHLFAERLKNSRQVLNPLLWKSTFKGNLDHMPAGALNKHVLETITGTGLGVNAQMTNPAEMLDAAYRVSKMGAGGISSLQAVPDESRNISHSQFHFIDPVVTPESGKAGVDARFSASSARDKAGNVYTKMFGPNGRPEWVSARDLQGKTVAPWESRNSTSPLVEASQDGEMTMVPRDRVHYFSSPTESMFSPVANMVPFKSASPPQRAAMGARMMTQALPLIGAETPWVQSGSPEGGSFEHNYGKHFGAVRAERGGKVMSVSPDAIKVKYNDGETGDIPLHVHELYDHAPGRKTHFTQSATVQPGATFAPGQLLARSNYTDQNGRVALGMNARTAWLPARRGGSFEDAFAISESYANRMKSDHMSLHSVEEPDAKFGKKEFRSLFPTKYPVEHLKDLDDKGVIKPGSIVRPGQPLILATKQSQAPRTTLVRSPKPIHQDASEVWDHDYPGEVVDVVKTRGGYRVSVKSAVGTQDGDKISGRHGNKGIVTIVPDYQMPTGEDGKPFDVLVSPYTLSSRQNASQIAELALGKLAAKHGKHYEIPDFHLPDLLKFAHEELAKHGEKSTETLFDPVTKTKIPGVLTGNQFFMKLHHLVEQKLKQRDVGGYDSFGSPAKGGEGGAKRMSLADTFALLSHGATAFLRGSKLARGQRNEKMWEAILSGYTPPTPGVPEQYKRFIDTLKGGGIHPVVENGKMRLKALTNEDIDRLAEDRELQNPKGIDWSRGGDPIKGGLFDRALHGEDGCFHTSTLIITDKGELPIGQIVKNRLAVKVLSYNFSTSEFEWKPIVNWFTNTSKEGLGAAAFTTEARASVLLGRTNKQKLWGTRCHQVYNAVGEKLNLAEATELQAVNERLSYTQEQLLYGGLLGDSHVAKNGYLSLTHGAKQSGYLWFKYKVFKPLCGQSPGMYHDESGGSVRDKIHFHTRAHGSMFAARRLCYVGGRKTLSQEWLDKVDVMGLAIWFFDDGSMKVAKGKKTVTITLSTECFSASEIEMLRDWLADKWELNTYTSRCNKKYKDRDCGWSICLSGSFADKLLDLVAPFTPDCLRHKLPLAPATKPCAECGKPIRKLRKFCNQCRVNQAIVGDSTAKRDLARIFGGNTIAEATAVLAGTLPADDLDDSVVLARQATTGTAVAAMLLDTQVKLELTTVPVKYQWKTGENTRYEETQKVYDIEVEGNHNYFAQGMLVSNSRWSKMSLHTQMPNPAFEDAVRYTLGITEKQMRNVIAGKGGMSGGKYFEPEEGEELPHNYETGSDALYNNLKAIDLDKEIGRVRDDIRGTKKTKRDLAIRRHKFLQGAKEQGLHPSQWMLSKVPILPPHFRPVSKLQGSNTELISDANYLYQDLWHANKNLQELSGRVHDTFEEKLAVYDALKAVTGLGDPINPKTQQKGVKGMLKLMLGDSPKWSTIQHKLLSSPVDLVGRSTVGPDANLDMDELGMPEDMAYKVYGKFVTKRLVQSGMSPTEAGHALMDRKPEAQRALLKEMEARPVSYHRAPVLHKYGHIGAWPKLVKGDVIKVSPLVIKGLGMDFDGDTANIHVPVYDDEIKDIKKMMPSSNLLSVKDFAPHYKPEREFHVGLWQATHGQNPEGNQRERVFADAAALKRAFQNGEVSIRDKVTVLRH